MITTMPESAQALFDLHGTIQPPRPSLRYRVGLLLVAAAMLVLPLLYAALTLGAASLVWWHITANTWIVAGHTNQFTLLLYLAPIIAGACLVFFLIKPIVATRVNRRDLVTITPDGEPELMDFINALCQHVGAPTPRRVQVDCAVNASASFMPGVGSFLRRDLVLTIGLPLVAGLSVRQFAGVLAHEFGHFTQGGAMRLSFTVRGINHWFARVVYGRDRWDQQLEAWAASGDWRSVAIAALARAGVWASRKALTALMHLGHGVSCFLLRQMEFDADAVEAQVAGTATFADTMARLRMLNASAQLAYRDLRGAVRTRTIPRDLPQFIVDHEQAIPPTDRDSLHRVPDGRTAVWDTHPSDADRVNAVERAAASGILMGGESPARALFRNFEALSHEVTQRHYQQDLNLEVDRDELVDTYTTADQQRQGEAVRDAVDTLFANCVSIWRPLCVRLATVDSLEDAELLAIGGAAREIMLRDPEGIARQYRQYEQYEERRIKAIAAEEFLLSGGSPGLTRGISELAEASIESARETQEWAASMRDQHRDALTTFEDAVSRRLACAVVRSDRASASSDMTAIAAVLDAVSEQMPVALEIYGQVTVIITVGYALEGTAVPGMAHRGRIHADNIASRLKALSTSLTRVMCPESLSHRDISVAAWVGLGGEGGQANPQEVLNRLMTLYFQLLGRIAAATLALDDQTSESRSRPD